MSTTFGFMPSGVGISIFYVFKTMALTLPASALFSFYLLPDMLLSAVSIILLTISPPTLPHSQDVLSPL
jgi:hypothetical protein